MTEYISLDLFRKDYPKNLLSGLDYFNRPSEEFKRWKNCFCFLKIFYKNSFQHAIFHADFYTWHTQRFTGIFHHSKSSSIFLWVQWIKSDKPSRTMSMSLGNKSMFLQNYVLPLSGTLFIKQNSSMILFQTEQNVLKNKTTVYNI